ncbi:MAG: CRISPR-associated protein Cas4, partial [Nanoarchaeota archaeon]|nr:CRISPR-associated protein Cas4 [Nanoarchaeota archaeon]
GVKPDFLIRKYKIIGDIKSGMGGFEDRYLLTCIGYALAYENEMKEDINFGIIYFFPTRHSRFTKPASFSQVYIFPIDDDVRKYFLDVRDQAYSIISRNSSPNLPDDKRNCTYCKFNEECKQEGLTYEE